MVTEPTIQEIFGDDPCARCLHRIDYHCRMQQEGAMFGCVSCNCDKFIPCEEDA